MSHPAPLAQPLAQKYLDVWNETDAASRRRLVEALFTADAAYVDPMMTGRGHPGIDAMIGAAQQQFAGHRFALHGTPDAHHDVVRFSWRLAAPGQPPVAIGTDVVVVSADGRLAQVTGFLEAAPAA
jgi:hypothetical protein